MAMPNEAKQASVIRSPAGGEGQYHRAAVGGPYPVGAGNPFVVAGYNHRLWIADYGGTDTIEVNAALLPG